MKQDNGLIAFFLAVFGLAVVGGALFVAWLIGRDALTLLAYVLIGGLVLAVIVGASSLPIRAWRKNDNPPVIERHFTDGTTRVIKEHTIDGRAQPVVLPGPGQPTTIYPELLRGAWQAGLLAAPRAGQAASGQDAGQDLGQDAGAGDVDGWGGAIH